MKLAKYKRYLRLAAWNERDIRYLPFVMIEREMPIEEARRMFAYSDWLISKAEEISGATAFRREYLGEWATAAQPSQSTDPTAPAAHALPSAPPETT